MKAKTSQKNKAIKLRKQGYSYSEIQKKVQVSQSSLSLWLNTIKLSNKQKDRLTRKGDKARKLGSASLKKSRILKTRDIIKKSSSEIKNINKENLMLIGTILYWAEGSKQKEHNPSKEVIFTNSDPKMIRIYLRWLKECLGVSGDRLVFEIYIHRTYKRSKEDLKLHWSTLTGIPISNFEKVYFKKNKVLSYRKNRGSEYGGVLRIKVRKSTDLNRKITGWVQGICLQSGVV